MRKLLTLFTLCLLVLTATALPNEPSVHTQQLAHLPSPGDVVDHTHNYLPQWETLGLEDLLAAGEESSVTAPPVQTRLGSRTHGSSHAPRTPFDEINSRPMPSAHTTQFIHSVPCGRFSTRPADYFIFFLSVMRR